jgi:hypothetical protein
MCDEIAGYLYNALKVDTPARAGAYISGLTLFVGIVILMQHGVKGSACCLIDLCLDTLNLKHSNAQHTFAL